MVFDDYAVRGGTFRENLLRQPGQQHLRGDHYGSSFDYGKQWDSAAEKVEHLTINGNGQNEELSRE